MKPKFELRELQWFGPLWRRILLAAVIAGWAIAEWLGGDQIWFYTVLAALAYIIWRMFIAFPSAAEIAALEAEQAKIGAAKANPGKSDEDNPESP